MGSGRSSVPLDFAQITLLLSFSPSSILLAFSGFLKHSLNTWGHTNLSLRVAFWGTQPQREGAGGEVHKKQLFLTKLWLNRCHQPVLSKVDPLHAVGVFQKGERRFSH